MHDTFEGYKMGAPIQFVKQQGEGGGREKRKGGKEKRKGGREEKERVSHSEQTQAKRTWNCATSGRFPPTLVILRLGAT